MLQYVRQLSGVGEVKLTEHGSQLTCIKHWIDGVLAPKTDGRIEIKRYPAVVRRHSTQHGILYRHIRLQCSTVRGWVCSAAHSRSRLARPAQRNVEDWRLLKLQRSCLPVVRHSARQRCVVFVDCGPYDFTHRIYIAQPFRRLSSQLN